MGLYAGSLGAEDVRDVTVYIYALVDPLDSAVRYVGKSHKPFSRYNAHVTNALLSSPLRPWLSRLEDAETKPILAVLSIVPPGHDSDVLERAFMHIHGATILNVIRSGKRVRAAGESISS